MQVCTLCEAKALWESRRPELIVHLQQKGFTPKAASKAADVYITNKIDLAIAAEAVHGH
jgi:hypothetical protein